MTPFLYPRQRSIEILAALYAGGLGAYIGFSDAIGGHPPIGWLGLPRDGQIGIALALIGGALLHGLGIRINGRSRFSPLLRLVGLLVHAAVAVFAVVQGAGSSASYTYTWLTVFLLVGAQNAARDCRTALMGAAWKPI